MSPAADGRRLTFSFNPIAYHAAQSQARFVLPSSPLCANGTAESEVDFILTVPDEIFQSRFKLELQ